ncbi:MAG: cation transporting ATPase C-terminal domain-containing protein, partial [Clostridia bacterium]|nr:cation transporting ATPase C-terminal domain-containing protein [Clostridia bacterium]
QNINVLNCRSEKRSVFRESLRDNLFVPIAIIFSIGLQLIMAEVPLTAKFLSVEPLAWGVIGQIFLLSLLIIVIFEIYKLIHKIVTKE